MYVHLTPRRGRRELFFDFRFRERAGRRGERFPGCNRSVCASRRRRASLSFSFLFLSVSAGDVFRQDSATFPSELWSYFSPSLLTCLLVNQSAGWGKKNMNCTRSIPPDICTVHSQRVKAPSVVLQADSGKRRVMLHARVPHKSTPLPPPLLFLPPRPRNRTGFSSRTEARTGSPPQPTGRIG